MHTPPELLLSGGGSFLLGGEGVWGEHREGRKAVSGCHTLVVEQACPFPGIGLSPLPTNPHGAGMSAESRCTLRGPELNQHTKMSAKEPRSVFTATA